MDYGGTAVRVVWTVLYSALPPFLHNVWLLFRQPCS